MRKRITGILLGVVAVAAVAFVASGGVGATQKSSMIQSGTSQPATSAPSEPMPLTCAPSDQVCQDHLALIDGTAPPPAPQCASGAAPYVQKLPAGEIRSCAPIPQPGPALPTNEIPAFQQLVSDVQTVVQQYASQGVVWRGPAATACAQSQACGEAYLRSPTASIIAPSDQVRRAFAVALTKALENTTAQGLVITVAPDVTFHLDSTCPDIKSNPQCWGQQTISPWQSIGQMRVDFAQARTTNLDSLTGAQIDALYGWSQP